MDEGWGLLPYERQDNPISEILISEKLEETVATLLMRVIIFSPRPYTTVVAFGLPRRAVAQSSSRVVKNTA